MRFRLAFLCFTLSLVTSCTPQPPAPDWASVQEITPAFLHGLQAMDPNLAVGEHGRLALTWVTRDSSGGADVWVAVSSDSGAQFSTPVRVNPSPGRVSSYSESRPVAAFSPAGELVVVWAAKRDSGEYADDLMSRGSTDGGRTFGQSAYLNSDHIDPRSTYHGFASLVFLPDGRALAAWIDGRDSPGLDEPMAGGIYASIRSRDGTGWAPDTQVASEVCACCRIALASEPGPTVDAGPPRVALAYRGMRGDLRDPRLALLRTDSLSVALDTLLSADQWFMRGCPSVGPGITFERSSGGHYLWFTGESVADSAAPPKLTPTGVHVVAWRTDGSVAGPRRALGDSLRDATRPMLTSFGNNALIGVVAHTLADSTRTVLAVRTLDSGGELGPWLFLGAGVRSGALALAHPRMAYAAWVEKDAETLRVRLARITRRER